MRRTGLPANAPRKSTDEQQHAADDNDVDRYKETCLAENRYHLFTPGNSDSDPTSSVAGDGTESYR